MNKEDLKKLGITDEAMIQEIIVLHGKDIESHKTNLTSVQTELANAKNQLVEADKTIEGFKKLDVDGIRKAADDWKAQAEKAKADAEAQIATMKFDYALDQGLAEAKARNAKAVRALLDHNALKIGEDGKIIGLSEQLAKVKTENDYLFDSVEESPALPKIVAGGSGKAASGDAVIIAARKAAGLKVD